MEPNVAATTQNGAPASLLPGGIKSASPLTALQLNGFRLDVKHTILTPEYLEKMTAAKKEQNQ